MTCPNCLAAMVERSLERNYGPPIAIDLCDPCQAFWFDDQEVLQLSPGATLELFHHIQQAASGARHPLGRRLACPRCRAALREAQDMQRNTKFSYFKCPQEHGRYLTYFQFLRAKNFVRTLTAKEIEELRRHVRQVNCTNCGAPIDVGRDVACGFCRTPVSMLDPDQVAKAVTQLQKADQGRQNIDPAWPLLVEAERRRAERTFADTPEGRALGTLGRDATPDLVSLGLRALASLWK
jgi:Zn-finger nucleic acid-binding protein